MAASGNRLICGSVLPFVWGHREIRRKTLGSVPDDFQEHSQKFLKKSFGTVCIEQLGSQWKDFHEIWYLGIFRNICRQKLKFLLKSDKNNGYYKHIKYAFMITSRSVLFRMKNISHKIVEKIKTHVLCSITRFFFSKNIPLMASVAYRGGFGVFKPPPNEIPKALQKIVPNSTRL